MRQDEPQLHLPLGVGVALLAAVLFGVSTPFAKFLLSHSPPVLLAALLYLGSGLGLSLLYLAQGKQKEDRISKSDAPWLCGAVLFGGIAAPVLLMAGLGHTPASTASLLLNLEAVFTSLLAWFVFHENFDRRIAAGMVLIVGGGVVLGWSSSGPFAVPPGSLAIAGACLCWGLDNNLTQRVSASNPYQVAAIKGVVAGAVNFAVAHFMGAHLPSPSLIAGAMAVGFVGYGLSLTLFVLALRQVGTARTGAYFSVAPFVGAAVSAVFLHEPVGIRFLTAAALMGLGVWLHLTETHSHRHTHTPLTHAHEHTHDAHHQHAHQPGMDTTEPHTHEHTHTALTHEHPHFPDIHHRHTHAD